VPELPEVETIRRQLGPVVADRRVVDAWSHPSAKFRPAVEVVGARLGAVGRRGKYLLVGTDDDRELVVHLGMTGSLRPAGPPGEPRAAAPTDPYVRARWDFDDGSSLEFRDVRRFGRLRVVPAGDYSSAGALATIGPEPLDPAFTGDALWQALKASRRRVKTQLLSQRPVAGIGNIYADEALWSSGVHPGLRRITRRQAHALRDSLQEVIAAAIDRNGTTLRDYRTVDGASGENQHHLLCYGRAGQPCLRCGTVLVNRVYDARTSTFCPACQRR
jgi:formamidopyrimidine-DNA glycosylase